MKNTRAIFMIGLASMTALVAVLLASRWLSQQSSLSTNKIAVAAVDINPGARLGADMVRLIDWPAASIPEGSFNDPKVLDTRVTRVSFTRGEPIIEARLAQVGATGGLSSIVAEGKRAMTVRVNDVVGVAGFALPGNFVDILVSTQEESSASANRDLSISKLVLERILVLAVAQEASINDTKPKVVNAVTLEVTPKQAEQLDLARSVGQLSLVLRNQVDLQLAKTEGATKQSLLSVSTPAPTMKEAVKGDVVQKPKAARKASREETCQHVLTGTGRITQCY
jgi:pilus assembly protein CpaB